MSIGVVIRTVLQQNIR